MYLNKCHSFYITLKIQSSSFLGLDIKWGSGEGRAKSQSIPHTEASS